MKKFGNFIYLCFVLALAYPLIVFSDQCPPGGCTIEVTGYRENGDWMPWGWAKSGSSYFGAQSVPAQYGGTWTNTPSLSPAQLEEAKKKEEKKKEDCKNKAAEITKAEAVAEQCIATEMLNTATEKVSCSTVTKATITLGGQWGFQGDMSAALKAFNIKVGAVTGVTASGTLEWNPREDCRLKKDDMYGAKVAQCNATATTRKAELAACP